MVRRLIAIALFVAACGGPAATPVPSPTAAPPTIIGSLTVKDSFSQANLDAPCQGVPDHYPEVKQGAQVTVTDGAGAIVGLGTLIAPTSGKAPCVFTFTVQVTQVPFYQITIASHSGLKYTLAEMQAANWTVTTTLGPAS